MLIKKRDIQKSLIENPKQGKGLLNKWDYIKENIPCAKIMTFSYIELEPGSKIGRHQHVDDFEIYYFIEGNGEVDDNNVNISVEAGDMLITKKGEYHSLVNSDDNNLKLIAFICS